jgi:hypothetical protein
MKTTPEPARLQAAPDGRAPALRPAHVVRTFLNSIRRRSRCSEPPGASDRTPESRRARVDLELLVDRVLGTIHNNSILLCGRPGIGKSSVLRELERRLPRIEDPVFEFFPVSIDLRELPEHRLFAARGGMIHSTFDQIDWKPWGEHPDTLTSEYCHRDLIADLRRVVRGLGCCSCRRVKIVLLIDGINRFNDYHPRTAQRLRGLFMTSLAEHLVMVAAGTRIDKLWEREGSPWYNFFEEIELGEILPRDDEPR